MLDPKSNQDQVEYSDILKPPQGFILQRAIGTTYSLDLQALLSVPVAMFYGKPVEAEASLKEEPLNVFDSIRQASEIVTIFCQKGKIKVPSRFNKLLSFTERSIHEIIPRNAFSSFHPKCWWLWYYNPESKEKLVRFAILSRNLTFDRSWDVSFFFEGKVGSIKKSQNDAFLEFLNYLEKVTGVQIEKQFKRDLERAEFKTEIPVTSWTFYPIGISARHMNPLAQEGFRPETLMMMSPFLDHSSVKTISERASAKAFLFSRKTELQKLPADAFDQVYKAFCIPDIIVNGEFDEKMEGELPGSEPQHLDLHAKLYINRTGRLYIWQLGSANLSKPAFERNIECLFEFSTADQRFSPEAVMRELVSTKDERRLFDEFVFNDSNPDNPADKVEQTLRKLEYGIINCRFSGEVIAGQENYFSYLLEFDATALNYPANFSLNIRQLQSDNGHGTVIVPGQLNRLVFDEKWAESQLSAYFVFSVMYQDQLLKQFIVKAVMRNLPESRHSRIIAEIINSKERFMQYLQFLLRGNGIVEDWDTKGNNSNEGYIANNGSLKKYQFPIYEELLKAVSRHPAKLKNIDSFMKKLMQNEDTKSFVSPELRQLWDIFSHVI